MSILASELKVYGSASMPDDDAAQAIGGAINLLIKVEFTDISPAGTVEMLSSAGGDTTQNVTITGRNAAGELVTEQKTVNGTSVVAFTSTFERILKIVKSASTTGTVTIRKSSNGGDLATLEPAVTQIRRPFYNAVTPTAGNRDYFEKVFFKNENGTLSLTQAVIKEAGDPSGKITFALETTLNGTGTNGAGNNRLVAPSSGVSAFDSADKNVANSQNHSAGAAQGVWLKLSLASTDNAQKTTYTLREEGVST